MQEVTSLGEGWQQGFGGESYLRLCSYLVGVNDLLLCTMMRLFWFVVSDATTRLRSR